MSRIAGWWTRLRRAWGRRSFERDLAAELRDHLDRDAERQIAAGVDPAEARRRAAIAFGSVDSRKEQIRGRRLGAGLEQFIRDAGFATRLLRKSPGFTTVAVATLAIGIGANTAIFSALDSALFRPLRYPDAHRLVFVFELMPNQQINNAAGGAYLDWREHQTQFEGLALFGEVIRNIRTAAGPERIQGAQVTHEFLRVLGVAPRLGRDFRPEEDQPGQDHRVVIVTEELWQSRLGGSPSILGDSLVIDDVPHTVIGVLPRGAWVRRDEQFFVPAVAHPDLEGYGRAPHWAMVMGRLQPGATLQQAEAELQSIKRQLNAEYPEWKAEWSVALRPMQDLLAQGSRPVLWLLGGAVLVVLGITCLNLANLLVARSTDREHEMAVRAALGASGSRIMRQVLTESLLLALLGGAGGVVLAAWGVSLLQQQAASLLPQALAPTMNGRVLAAAFAIALVTSLGFGGLPAWRLRQANPTQALQNGGRTGAPARRIRTQSGLVVSQVALSVVLLISAGLLVRSLVNVIRSDPGFEPHRALAFDLSLPESGYATAEAKLTAARAVLQTLRVLPGVDAAGAGLAVPGRRGGYGERMWPAGRAPTEEDPIGRLNFVTPGYFDALGARLVEGRWFDPQDDRADGPAVTVINASLAGRFFAGRSAIGEALNISGDRGPWRIIGVIADLPEQSVDRLSPPSAFAPFAFKPESFSVVVRTVTRPDALIEAVRRELRRFDDGIAVANARTLDQALHASLAQRRLVLQLIGGFAVVALVLAALGLYGVIAYRVSQRRREFSIRLALGAAPRDIVHLVLREALRLLGLGLVLGTAIGLATSRLLEAQLYQVSGYDPIALGATLALLAVVGSLACWWPAWRGSRADPARSLRTE